MKLSIAKAADTLLGGGVIAYPTEGVFGLGCMPDDVAAATLPGEPAKAGLPSMAHEPHYEAGDNYIYSNGRIETATRITDGLVHWMANDGSSYTAVNNFVMPPVDWENGSSSVQSTVIFSSTVKWPCFGRRCHRLSCSV